MVAPLVGTTQVIGYVKILLASCDLAYRYSPLLRLQASALFGNLEVCGARRSDKRPRGIKHNSKLSESVSNPSRPPPETFSSGS
jgi:hypothetical protein